MIKKSQEYNGWESRKKRGIRGNGIRRKKTWADLGKLFCAGSFGNGIDLFCK